MAKPVGRRCNLNCSYCYYLKKDKPTRDPGAGIMSEQMLEEYIRQYITGQNTDSVTFCWHGGESNTLSTINNLSEGKGEEIYLFLRDVVGSKFMQFLPVADLDKTGTGATRYSVTPEGYGKFLTDQVAVRQGDWKLICK